MSSAFTYKGYSARIELVAEENLICGIVVGIRDTVLFQGETVQQAKLDFERAIDFLLEGYAEKGEPPPKQFSGNIQFRVSPEIHAAACKIAELRNMSFNKFGEDLLIEAIERFDLDANSFINGLSVKSRSKRKFTLNDI